MIDLERKFSAPLDRERGMRRFSTEGGREELLGIISPAAKPGREEGALLQPMEGEGRGEVMELQS